MQRKLWHQTQSEGVVTDLVQGCNSVPADGSEVADLGVQEGDERGAAERTRRVQVGVVWRPAGHDLLVINQRVTAATQRAAGHQHLRTHRGEGGGSDTAVQVLIPHWENTPLQVLDQWNQAHCCWHGPVYLQSRPLLVGVPGSPQRVGRSGRVRQVEVTSYWQRALREDDMDPHYLTNQSVL